MKDKNTLFFRWLLVAFLIAAIDLLTKHLISDYLRQIAFEEKIYDPKIKIFSFFDIVYIWNKGISFGIFNKIDNSHVILSVLQGSIALILIYVLYKIKNSYDSLAFSFVIGGALGNVIDRILNGAVFDFLDFYIDKYHWPAFNFADSFIFIGVMILLINEFLVKKNEESTAKSI